MIFERLELERVRCFSSRFSCSFGPGLNAVFGPNESGKSTIFRALLAALFWSPTSTAAEVRSFATWGADRSYTLRLDFQAEGQKYRLFKDFRARSLLLEKDPGGEVSRDPKEVNRIVGELIGFSEAEVFLDSGALEQGRLARIGSKEEGFDLEEALREILTGAGQGMGAGRAVGLLDENIKRMTVGLKGKAYKIPGPIRDSEEKLARLQERRHRLVTDLDHQTSCQSMLKEKEKELEQVLGSLETKQALLDVEAERRSVQQSLKEHNQRFREIEGLLRSLRESQKELGSVEEAIESYRSVAELGQETLRTLEEEVARRSVLARDKEASSSALKEVPSPKFWPAWALLAAGSMFVLAGALAGPSLGLRAAAWALAGACILLGAWQWHKGQMARRVFEERLDRVRNLEQELEELESWLSEVAREAGFGSPEECLQAAKELARLEARRQGLLKERERILGGRSEESLEEERDGLARRIRMLETRLEEEALSGPALGPEEYIRLRREVEELQKRKEELRGQIDQLKGIIQASEVRAEELAELDEAIEEETRRLHRHRLRLRARQLARDVLEEAQREALVPARERFLEVVGRFVGKITHGRYGVVRAGERLADLEVGSSEGGRFVRFEDLSFGTSEQLLLAARLALMELLAGERKPPLLLDEPFGAFDEERLLAALDLLKFISQDRQVILFTHQRAVASACDHVVELPPLGGKNQEYPPKNL